MPLHNARLMYMCIFFFYGAWCMGQVIFQWRPPVNMWRCVWDLGVYLFRSCTLKVILFAGSEQREREKTQLLNIFFQIIVAWITMVNVQNTCAQKSFEDNEDNEKNRAKRNTLELRYLDILDRNKPWGESKVVKRFWNLEIKSFHTGFVLFIITSARTWTWMLWSAAGELNLYSFI